MESRGTWARRAWECGGLQKCRQGRGACLLVGTKVPKASKQADEYVNNQKFVCKHDRVILSIVPLRSLLVTVTQLMLLVMGIKERMASTAQKGVQRGCRK